MKMASNKGDELGFYACYSEQEKMDRESVVVGRWNRNNEVCLRCGASRTALIEMLNGNKGNRTIAHIVIENCPACKKALGGK